MNITKNEITAIANEVADELFNSTSGFTANRLAMRTNGGDVLGEWCRHMVELRIKKTIRLHLAESKAKAKRRRRAKSEANK